MKFHAFRCTVSLELKTVFFIFVALPVRRLVLRRVVSFDINKSSLNYLYFTRGISVPNYQMHFPWPTIGALGVHN